MKVLLAAFLMLSTFSAFATKQAVNRPGEASANEEAETIQIKGEAVVMISSVVDPSSPPEKVRTYQGYVNLECQTQDGIDSIRVLIQDESRTIPKPGCQDTAENAFEDVCTYDNLLGCMDE